VLPLCQQGAKEERQSAQYPKGTSGKQRYHCKDCKRASLEKPDYGYSEERKEEILKAYQERSSMRGIARTFGVSRNTLGSWLKKSPENSSP
jgi:transposase-like protein